MAFPTLRSLYLEALLESEDEEDAEVPKEDIENAPLGKYAFAPQRLDIAKHEPNTKDEEHLYVSLKKHIVDNRPIDIEKTEEIQDILSHDWYKTVFREPDGTYVFRGMSVSADYLRNIGVDNIRDSQGVSNKRCLYIPPRNSGSSSWSTEKSVARIFSMISETDQPYSIVLVAKTSDNPESFIQGKNGFYNIDTGYDTSNEKEVIGLGTIKVSKVYWKNNMNKYAAAYDEEIDEEDDDAEGR